MGWEQRIRKRLWGLPKVDDLTLSVWLDFSQRAQPQTWVATVAQTTSLYDFALDVNDKTIQHFCDQVRKGYDLGGALSENF